MRLLITVIMITIIVTLSVVPGQAEPGDSAFVWLVAITPALFQKLMHAVAYASLALLWMWTLEKVRSVQLRVAFAFILTVGLGAILEWYQTLVPGRHGTLADVLLNAVGSVIGFIAALFLL